MLKELMQAKKIKRLNVKASKQVPKKNLTLSTRDHLFLEFA
jgi:hypothetical protein